MATESWMRTLLIVLIMEAAATPEASQKRQLLVIMLDGMRWDYIDLMPAEDLGGFRTLKEQGVRAEYLEPVVPAMSFPNWRTLSTGLFPESHHVLGNDVYDRERGAEFSFESNPAEVLAAAPWWQDIEPIWTTATRLGKRVATIGWGRSDVPIQNILPEVAQGYPGLNKHNFIARVDEAVRYFQHGFDLVLMHYDDIDHQGHRYGPASPQVMNILRDVGAGFQRLFTLTADLPHIHVMAVADHGMTPACNLPGITLEKYIDVENDTEKIHRLPGFISIYAREGRAGPLYNQLLAVPGWEARLQKDIPEEFHVKRSRLAPDLLLFAHPGSCDGGGGGTHGPVPSLFPDMRGVFLAKGEAFVGGGRIFPPIRSVDVYQIYCHILGIEPRPHNGSWKAVAGMLKPRSFDDSPPDGNNDGSDGCRGDSCDSPDVQHSGGSGGHRGGDSGGGGGGSSDNGCDDGGGNQHAILDISLSSNKVHSGDFLSVARPAVAASAARSYPSRASPVPALGTRPMPDSVLL